MKSWKTSFKVEIDRENPICILGELLDFWVVLPIVMIVIWNHQICKAVVVVEVVVVQEDWKLSDCMYFIYQAGKHDPSITSSFVAGNAGTCGFRPIHWFVVNFLNLLCHHSGWLHTLRCSLMGNVNDESSKAPKKSQTPNPLTFCISLFHDWLGAWNPLLQMESTLALLAPAVQPMSGVELSLS